MTRSPSFTFSNPSGVELKPPVYAVPVKSGPPDGLLNPAFLPALSSGVSLPLGKKGS